LDGIGIKIMDLDSGIIRPSTFADLERATRVADALPQISFLWPCLSAQDKPSKVQPLYELYAMLKNSGKHIQAMTAVTSMMAKGSVEMAAAVVGGREKLKIAPILSNFIRQLHKVRENILNTLIVYNFKKACQWIPRHPPMATLVNLFRVYQSPLV